MVERQNQAVVHYDPKACVGQGVGPPEHVGAKCSVEGSKVKETGVRRA